jgi:peptidoglycan/LPS O-acetylase OafA/YrhL
LITGVIVTEISGGRFPPTHFYASRIRRLFPALVTVLMASFALGWEIMLANVFEQFLVHLVGATLFLSNFQFWSEVGYFDTVAEFKPLLHLWSLGVEE